MFVERKGLKTMDYETYSKTWSFTFTGEFCSFHPNRLKLDPRQPAKPHSNFDLAEYR